MDTSGQLEEAALQRTFQPPRGLTSRHTQSILASLPLRKRIVRRKAEPFRSASRPRALALPGGVRLLGYHTHAPGSTRGLVVLLHGWEGSADSHYILSTAIALNRAGFEIFRLNLRDHGDTYDLNEELFHSCRIDEVVDAVKLIQESFATRPMFMVGHSLGGNFALRTALRAQSAELALQKVVAVCPVLRPHSTMEALETGLWVYRHYYLRKWRRSLLAKEACFPDVYDFGDLRRFATLTQTTEFFVREHTEFPDLDTYLEGYAITGAVLRELSVPTRLIASVDDPIIPSSDLDKLYRSAALDVTLLPGGGHCGFLADFRLRSWTDQEIVSQLRAAAL